MKEKILQFGEGGFLRGFADWMLRIVNEQTDFDGSFVVIQPIKEGMCDVLSAQGCTYTHVIRGTEGVERKRINVISRCVKPYDDFGACLTLVENPSSVHAAGISFSANDKFEDKPANSLPGKLTQLLKRRYDLGLSGFVFLPCELNDKNGEKLKTCVLQYADLWALGDGFKTWIEKENIFCNTLVDRINTGYPKGEEIDVGFEDKIGFVKACWLSMV